MRIVHSWSRRVCPNEIKVGKNRHERQCLRAVKRQGMPFSSRINSMITNSQILEKNEGRFVKTCQEN